jgi:hypothetical protein
MDNDRIPLNTSNIDMLDKDQRGDQGQGAETKRRKLPKGAGEQTQGAYEKI